MASVMRAGRRPLLVWLVAFLGFFLLCGGYAIATPFGGTPDEAHHIIRAAGVVRGQLAPVPADTRYGTGAYQRVPASLVTDVPPCFAFDSTRSAACAEPLSADHNLIRAATAAGRYNPLYYLLVGAPLLWWPDMSGVIAARLLSSVLAAALVGAAFACAARWSRYRLAAAGVLVATTPMLATLAGAVNPNGLEIAAGLAFFAAAVPLFTGVLDPPPRWTVTVAGLSLAVLVTVRAFGPVWAVILALVLVVSNNPGRIRSLLNSRAVRYWLVVDVALTIAGGLWTVLMRTNQLSPHATPQRHTLYGALRYEVLRQWPRLADETIGRMAWLDTILPWFVYIGWYMAVGVLVLAALAFGRRIDRWRILLLAALGWGVPTAIELLLVNRYGFVSQGRYLLPMLVGVPVLAGYALDGVVLREEHGRRLVRTLAVVLLPLQLVSLGYTMVRYQSGTGDNAINPLRGPWHPVTGSVPPLVAAAIGLVLLALLSWRVTAPAGPEPVGVVAADTIPLAGQDSGATTFGTPPPETGLPPGEDRFDEPGRPG